MRIHPRASFESWKEVVRGRSRPFEREDREALSRLAYQLEAMHHHFELYNETKALRAKQMLQEKMLLESTIRTEVLRERELLLDSLGEGVFGVDAQGICYFINPAALRMLGYAEHEIVGCNAHDLIHNRSADDRPLTYDECMVQQTVREHRQHIQEEWLYRKDGSRLFVRMIATPLIKQGQMAGAVVAFSDISAEYEAKEQLQKLHRQLFGLIEGIPLLSE
ncbi:MAG: PAS domain S-box protein [Campylobacterales bacterium]|nr:PAS domain S-box protein [Campylobacterales bacterium]